jgi:alkylation response protein AidB-like acyl-CoA dehydrogenase
MNFDFTDDQQAIKRTARDLLADRFNPDTVRELAEGERYDDSHWTEIAELGWTGIFVDERYGGQGLGTVELTILAEELGYAVAPVPFLSNAAAGLALEHAGTDSQKERWLPGIASGEGRAAAGTLREGVAALVPDAAGASVLVLLDGDYGWAVEPSDCDVEPVAAIDQTRRYARVTPREGAGEPLGENVGAAFDRIATLTAAEIVGVAQRTMEMAVEYARDRQQFGRPIGAYQAVAHRCADMLKEVESSRSTTYWAAWAAESEPETLPMAAAMAKSMASDAGWNVTSSALQVLGGIGFTWEHDLQFFLKRAKVDGALFGSATQHRDRVASLAGL